MRKEELLIPYTEFELIFTPDNHYKACRANGHVASPQELIDWYITNIYLPKLEKPRRVEFDDDIQRILPHSQTW